MVGTLQNLSITRLSPYGAFLQGNDTEILLPKKFVDSAMCVGDRVHVFVAFDSEDRIVATTQIPKLLLGEVGALEIVDSNQYGYFGDLGIDKHLFIPHKAPKCTMIGKKLVVILTLDKQGRLIGKLGVREYLRPCRDKRLLRSEATGLVFERTPLGFGCAVDVGALDSGQKVLHYGLLYANEVAYTLHIGENVSVYIKNIRQDGKIDLSAVAQSESVLLEALIAHNGRVELDFKSSPQEIISLLSMSKKNFKTLANKLVRDDKAKFVESAVRSGHKALVLV